MSITTLTRTRASKALIAMGLCAMPLVVLAQQASSPTTSDPQTGTSATHMSKHKKAHTTEMSPNSTGGASDAPNAVGAGHGTTGNNSGAATAPEKGSGGGN
jgi:hypothetical protein